MTPAAKHAKVVELGTAIALSRLPSGTAEWNEFWELTHDAATTPDEIRELNRYWTELRKIDLFVPPSGPAEVARAFFEGRAREAATRLADALYPNQENSK